MGVSERTSFTDSSSNGGGGGGGGGDGGDSSWVRFDLGGEDFRSGCWFL